MTRPASATERITVTILLVALGLLGSACGISLDDEPRAIQTSASTTTTIEHPSLNPATSNLYYVLDEALVPVPTKVPDRATTTLITELLKPLPKADDVPFRSAIPPGTMLRSATVRGTQLTVDLSSEFENLVGVSRQRALAQIVFTVTDVNSVPDSTSIREVRFRIRGEDVQIASPLRGDVTTVGVCDFKSLLATNDQLTNATIGDETLLEELGSALTKRRASMERICGR